MRKLVRHAVFWILEDNLLDLETVFGEFKGVNNPLPDREIDPLDMNSALLPDHFFLASEILEYQKDLWAEKAKKKALRKHTRITSRRKKTGGDSWFAFLWQK